MSHYDRFRQAQAEHEKVKKWGTPLSSSDILFNTLEDIRQGMMEIRAEIKLIKKIVEEQNESI